jgi:ectoine hydroxylase-related dioxygenase (phytanoyl-CoA dioxygenase family)
MTINHEIEAHGFAALPGLVGPRELAIVEELLANVAGSQAVRSRGGVYAIRNLLEVAPGLAAVVGRSAIQRVADSILSGEANVVRATLFDKTAGANWSVPWHQDLTICVVERLEAPGFGPWTVKAGVHHVQPPADVLEKMIAVRIHLDDCREDNGALRVLPRTHSTGRLNPQQIEEARAKIQPVTLAMHRGGALFMRPLLLHASAPAVQPAHRRVVHLEFAAEQLPFGLRWLTS